MKKLYEKSEIWFAVAWIVLYVMVMGNLRNEFGDESIYTLLGLAAISAGLLFFVCKNKLTGKYGLLRVQNSKRYLWFLPIGILCTLNLWCGISLHYDAKHQLIAVINMALVGFAEEMIFRGLLFRAIEKENTTRAILISAITFGVGHIINLFTGQASFDTILQVLYAIAFGFAFVMMFCRSGSLIPCIVTHSLIDITSKFSTQSLSEQAERRFDLFGSALVIVVAGAYAVYLYRLGKKTGDAAEKV